MRTTRRVSWSNAATELLVYRIAALRRGPLWAAPTGGLNYDPNATVDDGCLPLGHLRGAGADRSQLRLHWDT